MSVECSDRPHGWNCLNEALAESRACPDAPRRFVVEVFDQLASVVAELAESMGGRKDANGRKKG
jgi:hypothetical protein